MIFAGLFPPNSFPFLGAVGIVITVCIVGLDQCWARPESCAC